MKKYLALILIGVSMAITQADEMVDFSFGDLNIEVNKQIILSLPLNNSPEPQINRLDFTLKKNTVVEYVKGTDGKHAAVISDNEFMEFQIGNLEFPKEATVIFRVKPVNWSGAVPASCMLLRMAGAAGAAEDKQGALDIGINSNKEKKLLVNASRRNGYNDPGVAKTGGVASVGDWKTDEWHTIAYSYSKDELILYIDGIPQSKIKTDIYRLPGGFGSFILGSHVPWLGQKGNNRTSIRDVLIFDKALSTNEIKAISGVKNTTDHATVRDNSEIPLAESLLRNDTVRIDGVLDEAVWQEVTRFTGFIDNTHRRFASQQPAVSLFHSTKGIYIGLESPEAGAVFRIIIAPPGNSLVEISTAAPVPAVKQASTTGNGKETTELFVPFSFFKAAEPSHLERWSINIEYRSGNDVLSWVAIWNPGRSNPDPNELGHLVFRTDEGPVIRLEQFSPMYDPREPYWLQLTQKATVDSGKLFYFNDSVFDGSLTRTALGENTPANQLASWKMSAEQPGAGALKNMNYLTVSAVDAKFRKVYYRSDLLPCGTPEVVRISQLSMEKNRGKLKVGTDNFGLKPEYLDQAEMTLLLLVAGKTMSERQITRIQRATTIEFPLSLLTPGKEFSASVTIKDADGNILGEHTASEIYPDISVWLGNRLGISDKVPPPFEAVKTTDDSIHCWNRQYRFDTPGIFPEQIISGGHELLASPVELTAVVNGSPAKLRYRDFKITAVNETSAEYSVEAHGDGIRIKAHGTVEFDGMLKCSFTVRTEPGTRIDSLKMQIPFKLQYARYLGVTESVGAGQHSLHYYGARPDHVYAVRFIPFIWMGDDDRGLLWFAESARNWSRADLNRALTVTPGKDRVTLEANIITRPVQVENELTYTVGLQASPVRPFPSEWRNFEKDVAFGPTDAKWFAYIPKATEVRKDHYRKLKEDGKLVSAYTFLNNVSTRLPEYNLMFDEWKRSNNTEKGKYYLDVTAPIVPSWQDFVVYSYLEGMRLWDIDGAYYDLVWPSPTTNPEHGGFINEYGKIENHWPILAVRRIAQRAYTAFREKKKQTAFWAHSSSNAIILPILSFCDFTLDGEQFAFVLNSYSGQLPLDRIRAEFTGRQFGLPPFFLPELSKSGNAAYSVATPEPTEEMTTLCYMHDIMVMPIFCNGAALNKFREPKMDFVYGVKELEFIPYWEKRVVTADNSDVLVSCYRKPGALMVMAANLTDQPTETALTVMEGTYENYTDVISKEKVSLDKIKIPPRNMRMLILKQQ